MKSSCSIKGDFISSFTLCRQSPDIVHYNRTVSFACPAHTRGSEDSDAHGFRIMKEKSELPTFHPDQGGADSIAGFKEIGKGNSRLQPLGYSREKSPGCGPDTN